MKHRVVIVGGGFGGLYAAKTLRKTDVDLTLIDRRNFHLFQPLLYQVATGALSPGEIASPLRFILNSSANTKVVLGEVTDVEVAAHEVVLRDKTRYPYDTLIIATGSTHSYFKNPQWASIAPGLKTIEDATEIRTRILLAFERAEKANDPNDELGNLTFVVVGGGPTGVELAGSLGEISRDTLKQDFRSINPASAKIYLVEGSDRLLQAYDPKLSDAAEKALARIGVETHKKSMVTGISEEGVTFKGPEGERHLKARTVLWAAGVQASPLGKHLAERTGVELDKAGRVKVEPDLSIKGHPEILIVGDLSSGSTDGKPWPGVAPTAIQQGSYAAKVVQKRLRGEAVDPFRYWDKGSLATIGRNEAVAQIGKLKFSGFFAWLSWLFIHIFYIVEFENRILILFQWAYDYITFNRGARLITGMWASGENALGKLDDDPAAKIAETHV